MTDYDPPRIPKPVPMQTRYAIGIVILLVLSVTPTGDSLVLPVLLAVLSMWFMIAGIAWATNASTE